MAARWRLRPRRHGHPGRRPPVEPGFTWWRPAAPCLPLPRPGRERRARGARPPRRAHRARPVGRRADPRGRHPRPILPDGADVVYVGALLWEREGARLPEPMAALGRGARWRGCTRATPATGAARALDSEVVLEAGLAALGARDLDVVVTTGHHELPPGLGRLPQRAPRALRPRTGHGPALRPDDPPRRLRVLPDGAGGRHAVGHRADLLRREQRPAHGGRRRRCGSRSRGPPGPSGSTRPPGPRRWTTFWPPPPTGSGPASSGGDSTSWGRPRCGPDPRGRLTAGRAVVRSSRSP